MINRKHVVGGYSPSNASFDRYSPFSVGNGEFAFTCDATGLQTFAEHYEDSIPLCTMSQWGWHSSPFSGEEFEFSRKLLKPKLCFNGERDVPYTVSPGETPEGFAWLRENPHRFSLAKIGFDFPESAGINDISGINQKLDLYEGAIRSGFIFEGEKVEAEVCVHPDRDALAVRVRSNLLKKGLKIRISFPAPSKDISGADFSKPDSHESEIVREESGFAEILRVIDRDRYFAAVSWESGAEISFKRTGAHDFDISSDCESLDIVVFFSPRPVRAENLSARECFYVAAEYWRGYWENGGFISIENGGERGEELQRRIILSQYLTAIQCAGSLPPAETGLTINSWFGKFHLEMHWWHSAHFPLWNKGKLLEKSMWYYRAIMPRARELARVQGYDGVRWPKMTDFTGLDAPSGIGNVLIWQQPHPIYYAEILYRENPSQEILERYKDIVIESAKFMASFLRWENEGNRYVLGPGLIPAQENHRPWDVLNPTFELEYWVFGLKTANLWLRRLDMEENALWSEMISKIARPAVLDGLYLAHENCPGTFAPPFNRDHPSMACALGVMPGELIDKETMKSTFEAIVGGKWQIETQVWGWDFPVLAMTAARLGLREEAVDALLFPSQKNEYLNNGHNKQADRKTLPLYLPGNGGLLTAVAMMCAGWDGCENRDGKAPGFPENWDVRWENLSPMP